jgi:CRP-like cAMP-binding protein
MEDVMETRQLGKLYENGEILIRQGEVGECMFVIQEGQVEILVNKTGQEVRVATRGAGEFIGEMAIFERDVRSATVRALGKVRALTIDKRTFLRRIHEDPSLAYRIVERLSYRVRELSDEIAQLKGGE